MTATPFRPARLLAIALLGLAGAGAAHAQGTVLELDLEGPLGVATAEYIITGIDDAEAQNAKLVIIRMDTPGGLVEPMRNIVSRILASSVPVATYVSPGGARADSAGTYILLASHIAAMAPTTHLGAATPVQMGGGGGDDEPADSPSPLSPPDTDPPSESEGDGEDASAGDAGDDAGGTGEAPAADDPASDEETPPAPERPKNAMERKVLNDAIAYIRGLAERHGRNAEWAEEAVRDAATLTADQALEKNVIDLIAADRSELLSAVNGRTVRLARGDATIDTENVVVDRVEPSWRIKFLSTIANPQVALLLMLVGVYGLLFEGYNPGAIVPGVVGVICLLLAAYALQVIPVNYVGLALILVGIALIVAEAFVPSFGALGLGGIAAFIFGAIMMFDSGVPGFGISITFVVTLALIAGLLLFWMATFLVRLQRRGAVSGEGSIVGGTAVAMESFTGEGNVWLEGEMWRAKSVVPVQKDQALRVTKLEGLNVEVEPVDDPGSAPAGPASGPD